MIFEIFSNINKVLSNTSNKSNGSISNISNIHKGFFVYVIVSLLLAVFTLLLANPTYSVCTGNDCYIAFCPDSLNTPVYCPSGYEKLGCVDIGNGVGYKVKDVSNGCYIESSTSIGYGAGGNIPITKPKLKSLSFDNIGCRLECKKISLQEPQNRPPKLLGYPNIVFNRNSEGKEKFVNLYDYFSDDYDSILDFELREQSNDTLINCFISNLHYLSCEAPTTNMLGVNNLKIRASDSKGLFVDATFKVVVENGQNFAPKISLIPDKTFEFGVGPLYKIVDLWYYTNDETPDNLLSFSLLSQSNPNVVSCNILENRFVSCTKPLANEGTNTLTIKVTDQEGLSSFATFSIIIIRPQQYNTAPYFVKIEDMTISYPNTAIVADLRSKAYDAEDSFDNLSFSIISRSNSDFYCYIEKPYLKCYPTMPRSIGPTLIALQVSDTQGATATTYFTLRGSNEYSRTPSLQGIPDLRIRENYSYTTRHVDLRNYVSDDNPVSELSFRVVSQSRSDIVYCRIANNYYFECDAPYRNKYGTSTIIVEVVDPQGNKDQDSFFVEVFPELTNSCNDIRVITYTVFMNGDERQVENFTIKNNSKYDFRITDVDLGEDSQYLRILDYDYDKKVLAYDETDLEVEFESDSTNYAREATGSIRIRGEFENGDVCSFSDIGTYYYRIRINPNYSSTSSTYCSDIKIITQDFSVNENSVNSKYFTLKNTSSRDFEITSISVSESSSYFNAKLERTFDEVSRYDEETFKITIESLGVSSTRTGEAEVRVSGRFSNGKYCSSSDIKKKFSVKVNDVATNVGTDNGANISITEPEIALSTSSISVFENQTKTINAIVKNKSNKTQCYRVSLNNSSRFTSSISNSNFCLSPNQSNTIDVRVSGRNAGSDNLELQLYYNNVDESIVNSKSRFVNIDVLKEQKPQTTIVIDLKSSTITENKLSLINSGDELNNVRVSIVDLPEGLKFKEVSVSVWKKNEQLDLEIKESSVSGKFQASVLVESKEATRVVPIEFEIPKKEDFITGLGSLVVWPITFILIIIILILAVFGLLSVVSKK